MSTRETDRRAYLRIKADAAIAVQRLGGDETFRMEEVGIAGFSIKSPTPFEPESIHHFRFADASGQFVYVGAICRYCTVLEGSEPASYLVGFQLESPPPRREPLILGATTNDAQ